LTSSTFQFHDRRSTATKRVMVVENDPFNRLALTRVLADAGYVVCGVAETVAEGKLVAAATSPDACLIDIALDGGSNGVDLAEWLIGQFGVPVVLMSGVSDPALVVPFLRKPFDISDLLDALADAMRSAHGLQGEVRARLHGRA
jgi:DNA-binding NtrC family response regulator